MSSDLFWWKRNDSLVLQPNPLGVTFSNAVSKIKAQSSKVSFATLQWNETFELWALKELFENVTESFLQTCTSAGRMFAASRSCLHSSNELFGFYNNKFDEMPCKLDSTKSALVREIPNPTLTEQICTTIVNGWGQKKLYLKINFVRRWDWVFLEPMRILSRSQFTRHFIEFVVVEIKQFVGSNVKVILTRQKCGQHSSLSAGSKRRALALYFCVWLYHMFLISKCRRESNLGLCTTSVLAKRMPRCIRQFRRILRLNTFVTRKSPPCSGIFYASTEVVHRPRSDCLLHFDMRNIWQIRMEK